MVHVLDAIMYAHNTQQQQNPIHTHTYTHNTPKKKEKKKRKNNNNNNNNNVSNHIACFCMLSLAIPLSSVKYLFILIQTINPIFTLYFKMDIACFCIASFFSPITRTPFSHKSSTISSNILIRLTNQPACMPAWLPSCTYRKFPQKFVMEFQSTGENLKDIWGRFSCCLVSVCLPSCLLSFLTTKHPTSQPVSQPTNKPTNQKACLPLFLHAFLPAILHVFLTAHSSTTLMPA
jgi:hypothetical protein